ncbi:MAG: AAA family ATPase, partial [Ktedonobacteraceae bacterium]
VQLYIDRKKTKRLQDQVFKLLTPKDLSLASFDDVVGHERIKKKLKGWARRLEQGEENTQHSILLTGEPGTGKSMLTRAFAARISKDTSLLNVNCEALLEKPETIVLLEKELKKLQKKNKPLVLLMDEIGTVGDRTKTTEAAQYSLIVRILKIMDGLGGKVAIVGTANNPERMDRAMRNRFPEVLPVPPPTLDERIQQLRIYLGKAKLLPDDSVNVDQAALQMDGLTGRRIEYVTQVLRNSLLDDQGNLDEKGTHKKHPAKELQPMRFNQQQLLEAIEDTQDPTEQKPFSQVG